MAHHENDNLKELTGSRFEIVEGEPDIRNWTVKNNQGKIIGMVEDLIFDVDSEKVRYIVLDLQGNELHLESRKVLIPIGVAELHESYDNVVFKNDMITELTALPTYQKGKITRNMELMIRNSFVTMESQGLGEESDSFYNHPHFNNENLYRQRKVSSSQNIAKRQTVIGVFDYTSEAQAAVERLVSNNFKQENIDITNREESNGGNRNNETGISNFFNSLMDDADAANKYIEVAKKGAIVTVHAFSDQEAERASTILDNSGAIDIDQRAKQLHSQSSSNSNKQNRHSTIIDKSVAESNRLRSQNNSSLSNTSDAFKAGTIEIVEHKEVPIVNKDARVTEEVSVKKDVDYTDHTIRDHVRKTEVDIDRFNNPNTD